MHSLFDGIIYKSFTKTWPILADFTLLKIELKNHKIK